MGLLVGKQAARYKAIGGSGILQVKGVITGMYSAPWLSIAHWLLFVPGIALDGAVALYNLIMIRT